ncbi:MAG: cob(I)yrinic acid a,c-diamide adenosyltransferase [Candidatus Omnitrophota bacterium]|jgi:cob(I)alamin adenosyltransferase
MIHVYTGNGKGKTTAALGLAVRASGAGLQVYFAQFIKGKCYSELVALRKFKNIKVEQFGGGRFIKRKPSAMEIELANKGINKIKKAVMGNEFDLIILDEVNVAMKLGLLNINEVSALIKSAPKNMEIVLTGRNAPERIIKEADLVSEIREVKHYYNSGLKARIGIEC